MEISSPFTVIVSNAVLRAVMLINPTLEMFEQIYKQLSESSQRPGFSLKFVISHFLVLSIESGVLLHRSCGSCFVKIVPQFEINEPYNI